MLCLPTRGLQPRDSGFPESPHLVRITQQGTPPGSFWLPGVPKPCLIRPARDSFRPVQASRSPQALPHPPGKGLQPVTSGFSESPDLALLAHKGTPTKGLKLPGVPKPCLHPPELISHSFAPSISRTFSWVGATSYGHSISRTSFASQSSRFTRSSSRRCASASSPPKNSTGR